MQCLKDEFQMVPNLALEILRTVHDTDSDGHALRFECIRLLTRLAHETQPFEVKK